jgi:hypothetical protein
MVLFLDFDGTCHPFDCQAARARHFCYLPRIEAVLRDFDFVRIVIASEWRRHHTLNELANLFSADMRSRVIGATPELPGTANEPLKGTRRREAMAYLQDNSLDPGRWLALDDLSVLWEPLEPNIILCDDGFLEREEDALRRFLQTASS